MSSGDSRAFSLRNPASVSHSSQMSRDAAALRGIRDVSGELLRKREIPGFTITEDRYSGGFTHRKHQHRKAFLTFVLEGSYVETCLGVSSVCGPGTLRFHPAGEEHENDFQAGLRCLHVEIDDTVLERLREQALVLARPAEITGVASTWLANRLYIEFCPPHNVSPMPLAGAIPQN